MRNLKRVLSLALALVMVLGMMVITTSAADYTDAEEITYTEAVDVMSGLKVFEGTEAADGTFSFNPTEVLSREQAATVLARIMLGKAADKLIATKQTFTDVAADRWSAKYIEYCYNTGLIDGMGDGTFAPDGELTGLAFAKLLLCAMGYNADAQGYVGKDWSVNISVDALTAGLIVDDVLLTAPLTRELAAQMILQALDGEMVEYRTSYDYATGAAVVVGPFDAKDGDTFQTEYFPALEQVVGVIEAVDGKGTYLGNTKVSATNVDWTDVGYAAYNWVLNGGKENVRTKTSISDIIIFGTSLGTSTEGVADSVLTAEKINKKPNALFLAEVDPDGCSVYYNGVYVAEYGTAKADAVLKIAENVGAKIDYVDNDNQGKAEAVIVTEYTFDIVTNVVKKSVSGTVSDYTYVTAFGKDLAADDVAGVDALVRGDFITYVEYDGTYYVTVLEPEVAELEYITREKLNDETYKVYTIDGVDHIFSELNYKVNNLKSADINEDVVFVTDEYGYIVYAEKYEDPDAYLYVWDNNDTDYLDDLTETDVVYADGTKDTIFVSTVIDAAGNKEDEFDNGEIPNGIYSYELDRAGNYVLTLVADKVVEDAEYETNDLKFGTITLNKYTTIVDLRKDTFGEVYTGYGELPDMINGDIVYYGDALLGYLLEGTDPEILKAEFVVFDTTMNEEDIVDFKAGKPVYNYTLEKGVLVRGELVTDYVLTEAQKNYIAANGVGAYTFDVKNGVNTFSFVPFTADTITWTPENWGTLIENDKDVTDDYTVVILNIKDGEISKWNQLVVAGDYYCYVDDTVKSDMIMYIVGDKTVDADALADAKIAAEKALKDYVALCDADTAQVPDVTAEALETVLAEAIAAMKKLDTVEAVKAYTSNAAPYGDGILMIWEKALEIQAAADAFANMGTTGTYLRCVSTANDQTWKNLYIEIVNFKFNESLKVVLYTAEGKEIGSVTAVPNSHSSLLAGRDIAVTSAPWYLAGANEAETHWVQTGSADYLNIPSYATLYIDGVAKESIKVGFDTNSGVDAMTEAFWFAWLNKSL